MENYTCCFVFIFITLAAILVVFAVSLEKSSIKASDTNNTVFIVLSMTLISMVMVATVICGVACRRSIKETEGKQQRRKGALYAVSTIGATLKLLKQSGEECPICWDPLDQGKPAKLSCDHVFHKECIDRHFKVNSPPTCPYCRATPLRLPGPERIKSDLRNAIDWVSSLRKCHKGQSSAEARPEWV